MEMEMHSKGKLVPMDWICIVSYAFLLLLFLVTFPSLIASRPCQPALRGTLLSQQQGRFHELILTMGDIIYRYLLLSIVSPPLRY